MAKLNIIPERAKLRVYFKKMRKLLTAFNYKLRKSFSIPYLDKLLKNKPLYLKIKLPIIKKKGLAMLDKIKKEKIILISTLKLNKKNSFNYENKYYIHFLKKLLRKERFYMRFRQIMFLNKSKFNSIYISPLISLLAKVYNKKVVFNIVTLKNYYLNSDIFTQILAIKIRNRKNRVLRVLKSSLRKVKLPFYNRLEYFNKVPKITFLQNLWLKDLMMVSLLKKRKDKNTDTLNNVLFSNFTSLESLKSLEIEEKEKEQIAKKAGSDTLKDMAKEIDALLDSSYKTIPSTKKALAITKKAPLSTKKDLLLQSVLNTIKHKTVSGIRIEAAGRVSRRLIASRAVFKVKHIGTIRNIDSSYKKLPSVILRGNLRSNVQFSKAKNKTRIGAFGLKG